MSSNCCIQVCHSDETLIAEVSFWAASAGYRVDLHRVDDSGELTPRDYAATIMELTGSSDGEIDVIEALAKRQGGRVFAVTRLDSKTVSSIRRLFQAKSIDAVVVERSDFSTRLLADLVKLPPAEKSLDRDSLAAAIRNGHIVVHYQPKVPFRNESVDYGVEALCRIQHPTLGLIYPDNFIPLAEAHDLILELTDAVTVQAFRDLATWDSEGRKLRLAINVSPRLMASMTWFELFEHRCLEHGIDAKRITLEVTESSSQGGKVLALEILSRLRLKGFLLSIDDFGTGFSSLETLYKLPFGELKIDKGFVFDLEKNAEARTLVESTVSLARKLGLKITAEGVESEEVFNQLRDLQCDDAQGYFISKPIAADRISEFFKGWETRSVRDPSGPGSRLRTIQALLSDILSTPEDDDDATMVLGSAPASGGGLGLVAAIPMLLLSEDWLGALERVHTVLRAEPVHSELGGKLTGLKLELERLLLVESVVVKDGFCQIALRGGNSFIIGRDSASGGADIALACRWLSRGQKNLRLFREADGWKVCDLGSTNGHFHNGIRLTPHMPMALPSGKTMLEIGKTADKRAPAWLDLEVSAQQSVSLSLGMADQENEDEAKCRWLLFSNELQIGGENGTDLPSVDCAASFGANIFIRDGGLWISPRPGGSLHLASREFLEAVPLATGCELRIGSATWRVQTEFESTDVVNPLELRA